MPNSQQRHSGSCRILVIEDDPDSNETLRLFLEINGHRVVTAFDGESAILESAHFKPEIVLCDITLGGRMDGTDVARAIRRRSAEKPKLMIALSGHSRAEDHSRSMEAGFDYHLVKPIDFEHLVGLINATISDTH